MHDVAHHYVTAAREEAIAGETVTGYDPEQDGGPMCLFCQMGYIYDRDVRFSPTVGDHYHPSCAKLTVEMHEGQQDMALYEEARRCLADQAQRAKDLGE